MINSHALYQLSYGGLMLRAKLDLHQQPIYLYRLLFQI